MISVTNVLTKMMYELSIVFVIILILHAAIGSSIEYPDVPRSLEEWDMVYNSEVIDDVSDYFDSEENFVADNEYPSEQLEKIVEETKELLESDDEDEKRKLKIHPSDYKLYRLSRTVIVGPLVGRKAKAFRGHSKEKCATVANAVRPTKLPDTFGIDHLILNVKNFKQKLLVTKCSRRNDSCGNKYTWPTGYEGKCEQVFEEVPLISIPKSKQLVKENQEVNYFYLPSGCVCKMKKLEYS